MDDIRLDSDVLVVGGGIAAVYAACKARESGARVLLVDKSHLGRSGCTAVASGVNHFYQPGDNKEVWLKGESNPLTNHRLFMRELPRTYDVQLFLERIGVNFIRDGHRVLRIPGPRIPIPHSAMMAEGGPQMGLALRAETYRSGVEVLNRVMITHLLTSDAKLPTKGRVIGAVGFNTRTGQMHIIKSKAVIMATGPWGIPFLREEGADCRARHMPINTSGESVAAMFDAGAVIGKLELGTSSPGPSEFPCAPALEIMTGLASSSIWMNAKGERFISSDFRKLEHGRSSIMMQILKENQTDRAPVGINLSHLTPEQRRLMKQVVPIVIGNFESAGYDISRETIPYTVGAPTKGVSGAGARINDRGETTLPGLFAAGNCSDGAYICIGQTLYIAALTGWWAGERAARYAGSAELVKVPMNQVESYRHQFLKPTEQADGPTFDDVRDRVHAVVLSLFPVISGDKLKRSLNELARIEREDLPRMRAQDARELVKVFGLKQAVRILELVIQVMEHRKESRGNILREDCPYTDNTEWLCHTVLRKLPNRKTKLWDIPVPEQWWLIPPQRTKTLHPFFADGRQG